MEDRMNFSISIIVIVAVIVGMLVLLWPISKKGASNEWEHKRLSDENVMTVHAAFEKRLDESADLHNGIYGRQAYIYRKLMSK